MAFGDLKVQDLIYEDSSNNEITVVIADLLTKNNPSFTGNATGVNLTLSGNLTVNGTTTTIDTTTLQVEDKNIEIGKVSSPSDTTADGGGWSLLGSTTKTFNWVNATDAWTSSENIQVASGKTFIGDGSTLTTLNASNLASGTVATARLGTGTADNTTYLRGDGAWTSTGDFAVKSGGTLTGSWQWNSGDSFGVYVETNPGHKSLEFKDNAAASFGNATNGDLVIYHSGSHSYIEDRGTGNFIIKTSELDVMNAAGNEDMIKATQDGSVELYENNVKRLETTTTGINVIGAINVNGAALSSAPTITATASGTIAANAAVNLKTDGKVESVTAVTKGATQNLDGNTTSIDSQAWTYDTERDKIVAWYIESSNIKAKVGTISGSATSSSISWGSASSSFMGSASNLNAYFCPLTKRHLVVWAGNGDHRAMAFSLAANGTLSAGGQEIISTHASTLTRMGICQAHNDTSHAKQIFVAHGYQTNNQTPRGRFLKINPSDNSLTMSTAHSALSSTTGNWTGMKCSWDSVNQKIIVCYNRGTDDNGYAVCYDKASGSWGTQVQINSTCYYPLPLYLSESDSNIIFYNNTGYNPTGTLRYVPVTYSSTANLSLGSDVVVQNHEVRGNTMKGHYVGKNTATGIYYFVYCIRTGTKNTYVREFTVAANGTITFESGTGTQINSNETDFCDVRYDDVNGTMLIGGKIDKGSDSYENGAFILYPDTTSATNDNFIGFSSAAYSDGDTATINVVGNTTTQSSLTPASTYYVQHNGSLATTPANPSIVAGKALSSTKLLIKG